MRGWPPLATLTPLNIQTAKRSGFFMRIDPGGASKTHPPDPPNCSKTKGASRPLDPPRWTNPETLPDQRLLVFVWPEGPALWRKWEVKLACYI